MSGKLNFGYQQKIEKSALALSPIRNVSICTRAGVIHAIFNVKTHVMLPILHAPVNLLFTI